MYKLPTSISFAGHYLTDDVLWGNEGDTYLTLGYERDLPMNFALSATLGYYIYEKKGKFINNPKVGLDPKAQSSAFRHLDLALSHPIGKSGADFNLIYTIGGEDRSGNDQDDMVVLAITYGFDL